MCVCVRVCVCGGGNSCLCSLCVHCICTDETLRVETGLREQYTRESQHVLHLSHNPSPLSRIDSSHPRQPHPNNSTSPTCPTTQRWGKTHGRVRGGTISKEEEQHRDSVEDGMVYEKTVPTTLL